MAQEMAEAIVMGDANPEAVELAEAALAEQAAEPQPAEDEPLVCEFKPRKKKTPSGVQSADEDEKGKHGYAGKSAQAQAPDGAIKAGENPFRNEISNPQAVKTRGEAEAFVNDLLGKEGGKAVVVFSKSWCGFSRELKRSLDELRVRYFLVELDNMDGGGVVLDHLKDTYNHKTVPQWFVAGDHKGGCDELKTLIAERLALPLLRAYMPDDDKSIAALEWALYNTQEVPPESRAFNVLFAFPDTVNNRVIRRVGMMVFFICLAALILIYTRQDQDIKWVIFGLCLDYVCRMVAGAGASPIGILATLMVANQEPIFKPGPPKQFAAFCGFFFSGVTALLWLTNQIHAGSAVLAILMICAGMEAFLDFCVGCMFFGFFVQFKLIPNSIYKLHTNSRDEKRLTWREAFTPKDEGPYEKFTKHVDPNNERSTDLNGKIKSDEQKQEDFDVIRHMKLAMFDLVLGINGLALMFLTARSLMPPFRKFKSAVWEFFALAAIILWGIFAGLYTLKLVLYPKKVFKEVTNPLTVNSLASVLINLMLFAYYIFAYAETDDKASNRFSQFLLFFAGGLNMLLTLYLVGGWFQRRYGLEQIDASWMMAPLGNVIVGIVAATLNVRSSEELGAAGWFWYASGTFMFMILMPINFFKIVIGVNADDRRRNGLFIWCAAPAAIAIGYLFLTEGPYVMGAQDVEGTVATGAVNGPVYLFFFWSSYFMALLMIWNMAILFIGRAKFGVSYYAFGFPMTMVATAALIYQNTQEMKENNKMYQGTDLTRGLIAYPTMGFACWFVGMNFLHTVMAIVQGKIFRPMIPKWGVLSFMRLTHYAFHKWIEKAKQKCDVVSKESDPKLQRAALKELAAEFNIVALVHEEHARHEDEVIFREAKTLFPGFSQQADDDHERQHQIVPELQAMLNDPSVEVAVAIERLTPFLDEFKEHLLWEEAYMQPILRKYTPIELQKDIVQRVWLATPFDRWGIFIPWVLRNQYKHQQRVMWLKTLTWAMPYRAQMIGLLASRGVSDVIWAQISQEMPEIIPRGLPGWRRQL